METVEQGLVPGHRVRLWHVLGREFKSGEAEGEESPGCLVV